VLLRLLGGQLRPAAVPRRRVRVSDELRPPLNFCNISHRYDYKNRRQVCHQCCGGQAPCAENRGKSNSLANKTVKKCNITRRAGKCNGVEASCQCKVGYTGENCNVCEKERGGSSGCVSPQPGPAVALCPTCHCACAGATVSNRRARAESQLQRARCLQAWRCMRLRC
jgi:hypothetical protein